MERAGAAPESDAPAMGGSGAAPSLSGHAGHDRKVIRSVQRRAGNRAAASVVRGGSGRAHRPHATKPAGAKAPDHAMGPLAAPVQRRPMDWDPQPMLSEEEKVARAAASLDKGDIKKIRDWSKATEAQKLQFVDALNGGWTGPMDEYALEAIWASFGDEMIKVAENNPSRWESSLKNGAELYKLGAAKAIADRFLIDVRSIANGNLDNNDKYCVGELARLGEGDPSAKPPDDGRPPQTPDQRVAELQGAAKLMKAARGGQSDLSQQVVGLRKNPDPPPGPGESLPGGIYVPYVPVLFNATAPPPDSERHPDPATFPPGTDLPEILPWDDVKADWNGFEAFLDGLTMAYPVLGIAASSSADAVGTLAGDDPKAARTLMVGELKSVRENISKSRPKVGGTLAYELKPIHDTLFAGSARPSGIDWSKPVAKSLATELVELHDDKEFWVTMGLSAAAAALFIIANFVTFGTATAVLIGAGVGIGLGQAAVSWDKALDMRAAAKASPQGLDPLVTSGQADMALFEAVLNTLLVAVDAYTGAKTLLKAAAGGVVRGAMAAGKGVGRAAVAGLEAIAKVGVKEVPAGSAAVIEKAIVELGVEQVAQRTGKSAAQLLEIVGKDSPIAERLRGFVAVEKQLAAMSEAELIKRSGALEAEIKANATLGQQIALLATERLGPKNLLERNGGWAALSLILGNDSPAGKLIMAWRDGIMADIEAFVKTLPKGVDEAGEAAVKRTGSQGKFTNDFDVSLLGPGSSENRNAVRSFVAGRLGTSPDRLKLLVLADFFTDPRRLHLYDQLDPVLRQTIASRAEKVAEGTIFARMVADAEQAGNTTLAQQLRKMMTDLKVEEVAFKKLGVSDLNALYKDVDTLHVALEKAIADGDKGAQAALVNKIGDTQGLINAAEGGGYFSGGGSAMLVSIKEGLMAPGAKLLPEQTYTALLDQLPKLYGDANTLLKAGFVAKAEVVDAIKGIAKYGKRFRDLMKDLGVTVAEEGRWNDLATRLEKILKEAKGEAGKSTLQRLATDTEALQGEVNALLSEFSAQAPQVLGTLSKQAGLTGRAVDLATIQFLVMAQAKLSRASAAVKASIAALIADLQRMAMAAPDAGVSPQPAPGATGTRGAGATAPGAKAEGGEPAPVGRLATGAAASPVVQRGVIPGFLRSDKGTKEEIAAAIKSEDPADIKAIDDFSLAEPHEKVRLVQIMLNKTNLWAFDRRAVARLWNSFPDLEKLTADQVAVLRTCIDRGFDRHDLKRYPFVAGDFRDSVKAQVVENLGQNITTIQKEADRLGLSGDKPKTGGKYDEQVQELQDLSALIHDSRRMLAQTRRIVVGHTGALEQLRTGKGPALGGEPVTFKPDVEPQSPMVVPVTRVDRSRREMPWQSIYPGYAKLSQMISAVLAQNPALYALETLGEAATPTGPPKPGQDPNLVYGEQSRLTGFEQLGPEAAREKLRAGVTDVYNNARMTLGRVTSGKMRPLQFDLVVDRHKQGAFGPKWSSPYARMIADLEVAEDKSQVDETMEWLGLALLLGAVVIGTGGAAGPVMGAILAGANVGSAVAAAAFKTWEAGEAKQAAQSGASADTAVMSQQQADRAALDATLYQFMAIASVVAEGIGMALPATRAGANLGATKLLPEAEQAASLVETLERMEVGQVALRTGMSPEEMARVVGTRAAADARSKTTLDKILDFIKQMGRPFGASRTSAALEGLGSMERKAAADLIEKTIVEEGIEATLAKSKKSAKELLDMVGTQSVVTARLKQFIALPESITKLTNEQLGERLVLLAAEVRKNPQTADGIVALSIERLGPLNTLRKAGGWSRISKALGREGVAMQTLVTWRETAMTDLYEHLTRLGASGTIDDAKTFLSRRFGGSIEDLGIGGAKPLIEGTGDKELSAVMLRVADDRELATKGLMNAGQMRKMAAEGLSLRDSWGTLTPRQRGEKLLELANARLKEVGVPPMKSFEFSADSDGAFLRSRWKFYLRESILQNEAKFDWLLEAAYHEARHAEQMWQVARVKAKEMPVDLMIQGVQRGGLSLDRDIALLAHSNPLDAASAEGRQALRWFESLGQPGQPAYKAAYAAWDEAEKDWMQQVIFYEGVKKKTPQLTTMAKEFVDKAFVNLQNAVKKYMALAEEADAYAVQARFRQEYEEYKRIVSEAMPDTKRLPKGSVQ